MRHLWLLGPQLMKIIWLIPGFSLIIHRKTGFMYDQMATASCLVEFEKEANDESSHWGTWRHGVWLLVASKRQNAVIGLQMSVCCCIFRWSQYEVVDNWAPTSISKLTVDELDAGRWLYVSDPHYWFCINLLNTAGTNSCLEQTASSHCRHEFVPAVWIGGPDWVNNSHCIGDVDGWRSQWGER